MNKSINTDRYVPVDRTIYRTIIFSLFLILLSVCPGGGSTEASGATYYVKTGGDDSLQGLSDSTAWATIAKVAATAKSGDTVYFRSQDTWTSATGQVLSATAGVIYDGSTYGSGTRATVQASAALDAVVKIYASNVTFRGFNINGNSQIASGIHVGTSATSNISNIVVDNCIVHDLSGINQAYYGIHVGSISHPNIQVSNVSVTNTTVYNTPYEGIALYSSWGQSGCTIKTATVRNCIVHDTGHVAYPVGIMVANTQDDITVEFNLTYNNVDSVGHCGGGISIGISGSVYVGEPTNVRVRYNLSYGNDFGITIGDTSGTTLGASVDVYDNIFYNNTQRAINVGWLGVLTSKIYNNTVSQSSGTSYAPVRFDLAAGTSVDFKNNIITIPDQPLIQYYGTGTEGRVSKSNNLLFRSDTDSTSWILKSDYTYYSKAQVVSVWDSSAIVSGPLFTGGTLPTGFSGTYGSDMVPNTTYFAITSGDALDHGATLGSPYNGCINGAGLASPITRPQGGAYNIGAYEYTARLSPPAGGPYILQKP